MVLTLRENKDTEKTLQKSSVKTLLIFIIILKAYLGSEFRRRRAITAGQRIYGQTSLRRRRREFLL